MDQRQQTDGGNRFYIKYTSTHLMDNTCPGCGGSGIQTRNDGVKIVCPVCGGSGRWGDDPVYPYHPCDPPYNPYKPSVIC